MICNTNQKDYYDWALVLVPIFISVAVALISFFQYRINSHKFRLDLYNRRFSVYEKALAYFQSYYSSCANVALVDDCATDFIRVYRESIFLFGADSTVYRELTVLKDTLSFLVQFDRKFKTEPRDPDQYKEWSKLKQSKPDPHTIMAALENALLPWLDFKKVGK